MTILVHPSLLKASLLSDHPVKLLLELNSEVCVDKLQWGRGEHHWAEVELWSRSHEGTSHPGREEGKSLEFPWDFRGGQVEAEARLCVLSHQSLDVVCSGDRHSDRASGTALCLRGMPREGPSNWGMSDSLLKQMLRLQQIWMRVLEIPLKLVVLQKSQPLPSSWFLVYK